MKKRNFFFLWALALVISLACNETDPGNEPELSAVDLTTADFDFSDWGVSRIEYLNPNDLDSPDPTHVNYSVAVVTSGLRELTIRENTYLRVESGFDSGGVTALVFNLYAPITMEGGTAAQNLLGGERERVFNVEDFASGGPSATDYFYVDATLVSLDYIDSDQNRDFLFSEGSIMLSGTAPEFTLSFDVIMRDHARNVDATFVGSTTGNFKIFDNN